MWPTRRPSSTSSSVDNNAEPDGIPLIPLADLRSRDSVASETQLVAAHPTTLPQDLQPFPAEGGGASGSASTCAAATCADEQHGGPDSSPSSASSASPSQHSSSPAPFPFWLPNGRGSTKLFANNDSVAAVAEQPPLANPHNDRVQPSPPAPEDPPAPTLIDRIQSTSQQQHAARWPQRLDHRGPGLRGLGGLGRVGGAPAAAEAAAKTGEYMRGIARAIVGAASGPGGSSGGGSGDDWTARHDTVDPVAMLLPDCAMGDRVGGPTGRGPLLRRLQTNVHGMLNDFVVVTISCAGPLHVRLKPDPRGLVIVNNFDPLPDDPHTSCPRLGPLESVGNVMPGDALASVNREVLLGRPFSECVKCIRDASLSATAARPCLLCFRKADPECLEASLGPPPRSIEQEKLRSLERLLEGGDGGLLDEAKLRGITSTGVPDQGELRPVLWRVLLRCLPANRLKWAEHLTAQRALYARFVDELVLKPVKNVTQGGAGNRGEEPLTAISTQTTRTGYDDGNDDQSVEPALPPASHPLGDSIGNDAIPANIVRSPPAKHGTNGPIHACEPPLERDIGERILVTIDVQQQAAESAAPSTSRPSSPGNHSQGGCRQPADDDPLSNKDTSEWAALWCDKELMQAIEQDVIRTMPDLAFYACRGVEEDEDVDVNDGGYAARREQRRRGRERREALARILFVHAKLNPAESYTQGMNEIVATLYFVLATDRNEEWNRHCEADTFFCFTNLMAEIRDVFIQSLDESESGLQGKMEAFSRTLRQHDPELAEHMVSLALDPRYFALRWFTTLLSREFDLPDTIRLWDSLFAAQDRSTFLVFVFVTLLLAQRETLLAGDFASNLQLLQAYPPTDVPEILAQSEALRLFSARGDAARAGGLAEQRAREASDGAKQAAEQVNAAARRFWNAASDLATFHLHGEQT